MKSLFKIFIFITLSVTITATYGQACTIAKCDTLVDTALYVMQNKMIIDGKLDEKHWQLMSKVKNINPFTPYSGPINDVTFGTLWNEKYFYVGVKVIDGTLNHKTGYKGGSYYPQYLDDAVELFINPNKGHNLGRAMQFVQAYNEINLYPANAKNNGVLVKQTIITGGYSVEFAIPWDYFFPPEDRPGNPEKIFIGKRIGFDVSNDDDDAGQGTRQYQLVWNNKCDNNNYLENFKYGTVVLSGESPVDIIAQENSIAGPAFLCATGTANYTVQPRKAIHIPGKQ